MHPLRHLLASASALTLSALSFAQGRIVIAHDEWTLSNNGFQPGPDAAQFARNVAGWFTGGQPGHFRVWSGDFGLTESALSQTMTAAGHTWTISTLGTFQLSTLQQYDAVFIGNYFDGINAAVLTQYVRAGGCVYVCAGNFVPLPRKPSIPSSRTSGSRTGASSTTSPACDRSARRTRSSPASARSSRTAATRSCPAACPTPTRRSSCRRGRAGSTRCTTVGRRRPRATAPPR